MCPLRPGNARHATAGEVSDDALRRERGTSSGMHDVSSSNRQPGHHREQVAWSARAAANGRITSATSNTPKNGGRGAAAAGEADDARERQVLEQPAAPAELAHAVERLTHLVPAEGDMRHVAEECERDETGRPRWSSAAAAAGSLRAASAAATGAARAGQARG